ncbi:hypothetical protein B0H11DRAFT_1926725 [Mycena galericulata]|nr:hypothetical protein B0H11DRAFT_1926725 [Mycena galericulata]
MTVGKENLYRSTGDLEGEQIVATETASQAITGSQVISVDGKPITVPIFKVNEFCMTNKLSDDFQQRLKDEEFKTAQALLDAAGSDLEKNGLKSRIEQVKEALGKLIGDEAANPDPED